MNIKLKILLNKFRKTIERDFFYYKKKLYFTHIKRSLINNEKNNVEKNIWPLSYIFSSKEHFTYRVNEKLKIINGNNIKVGRTCENNILPHFIKKYGILNDKNLFMLIIIFALYELLNNKKKKHKQNGQFFPFGNKEASCCGIMAYIGNRDASKILMDGIELLQNRGYDSCGMSTISTDHVIKTTKYASTVTSDSIEKLKNSYMVNHKNDHIGIAHTRWATHGNKSDDNAHPHTDYGNRISLVHNGIIENYRELKNFLLKNNIPFKSNTDTEVVSNLIGYYLDKGEIFEDAVLSTIAQLEGTWSFCIIHETHPDKMILSSNGSPLHVGFKEDEIFVTSEPSALYIFTNEYLTLENGETIVLSKDKICDLKLIKKLKVVPEISIKKTPHPFPHWTIKEIHEQIDSISKSLNNGGRFNLSKNSVNLGGLESHKEYLSKVDNIVLVGCGSSYYAALYGKYIMNYLNCFNTVQVMDPVDFNALTLPKEKEGIIFISQSGETKDVIKACQLAHDLNLKNISVVNTVASTIASMTGCGVYLNAGREVGVASTKSFTSQVSVLTLIALWFFQNKNSCASGKYNSIINSLHKLTLYADWTIKSCESLCQLISDKLLDYNSLLIIGNGLSYPIALEGALKLKELTYIHSEGFTGNSLKHGPYALLGDDDKVPVIMLVFNDSEKNIMVNTGEQIKSRGAHIICITDDENLVKHFSNDIILIPNNGLLTPLLAVIPLQMLAYYISVKKGINPDTPRCLAKTVTVS